MRVLRFFDEDGTVHLGIRKGAEVLDLGESSPMALMSGARPRETRRLPAGGLRLDAPLRNPSKVLALAGNYRKHVAEAGLDQLAGREILTPQVFWKPPTAINAPGGTICIRPNNVFVDWEIELAVVIGRRTKDVPEADAMASVFGYTIVNDISERKFNSGIEGRTVRQFDPFFDFLMGKWFDGHLPMGPEIVTREEAPDPHDLAIRLWLNGTLMQDSRTSCMIFGIPETIAYISSVMTLEPGDVIAMGTPDGVGMARGIALRPGDRLAGEIEGLGTLENTVAMENNQ